MEKFVETVAVKRSLDDMNKMLFLLILSTRPLLLQAFGVVIGDVNFHGSKMRPLVYTNRHIKSIVSKLYRQCVA